MKANDPLPRWLPPQCLPCKLRTADITTALEAIPGGDGSDRELDPISERLRNVADANRCYLLVQEQKLVATVLRLFPEDFAAYLDGRCRSERTQILAPKRLDLVDGVVTYDLGQERKQPDWTYQ